MSCVISFVENSRTDVERGVTPSDAEAAAWARACKRFDDWRRPTDDVVPKIVAVTLASTTSSRWQEGNLVRIQVLYDIFRPPEPPPGTKSTRHYE